MKTDAVHALPCFKVPYVGQIDEEEEDSGKKTMPFLA